MRCKLLAGHSVDSAFWHCDSLKPPYVDIVESLLENCDHVGVCSVTLN